MFDAIVAKLSMKISPRNIVVAFIVIIVAIALLVAGVFGGTQRQANLAEAFVQHLLDGNVEEAYALTSSEFRQITTEEILGRMAELPQLTGEGEFTFSYRHFENALHTFAGDITNVETEGPVMVQVIREDGALKVVFFSLDPTDDPRGGQ